MWTTVKLWFKPSIFKCPYRSVSLAGRRQERGIAKTWALNILIKPVKVNSIKQIVSEMGCKSFWYIQKGQLELKWNICYSGSQWSLKEGAEFRTEAVSLFLDKDGRHVCKLSGFLFQNCIGLCLCFCGPGNIYCVERPCTENQGYMTKAVKEAQNFDSYFNGRA